MSTCQLIKLTMYKGDYECKRIRRTLNYPVRFCLFVEKTADGTKVICNSLSCIIDYEALILTITC